MTQSIPADALIRVVPSVLGAGGNPIALNSVFVTQNPAVPVGTVLGFSGLDAVVAFFGTGSVEALRAANYFAGFDSATTRPGKLWFTQYNTDPVGAYLRGGSVASLTLSQLQGLSGLLTILVDGEAVATPNINLAAATSFSNAATLIQAGLQANGAIFSGTASIGFEGVADQTAAADVLHVTAVTQGKLIVGEVISGAGVDVGLTVLNQLTGTPGGVGTYTVSTNTGFASTTIQANDSTLTVAAVASGALHVGDTLTGAGVTVGTTITALGTGTGGVGTYVVSAAQNVPLETIQVAGKGTCTYDAQRAAFVIGSPTTGVNSSVGFASGSLSAGLKLTLATGAVQSPGAAAATPAGIMDTVKGQTQNWATFFTTWEPDTAGKVAFADWVQAQNQRYAYSAWDSDITPTEGAAPASFGQLVKDYDGIIRTWEPNGDKAAFVCGAIAAIDNTAPNGRITLAYKHQAGLTADVTDKDVADNLLANGYNFYGQYATANDEFVFYYNGQISGQWKWIDPYINQIYFNSQLQLAFLNFFTQVKSNPYNRRGYNNLRAVAKDPIDAALLFGTIQTGVQLSEEQKAAVNQAAGLDIADTLENAGFYLQVLPAAPIVRTGRSSPPISLWYTDGGSIQQINFGSTDIE